MQVHLSQVLEPVDEGIEQGAEDGRLRAVEARPELPLGFAFAVGDRLQGQVDRAACEVRSGDAVCDASQNDYSLALDPDLTDVGVELPAAEAAPIGDLT